MIDQFSIVPILLFSIIAHEVAHGYVALKLGDPTAKTLGRLTFNPIPHIDPIGSIFIPLLSLVSAGSVLIAWAKPVPVNRNNFIHPRRDDVLVSLAGPGSNIIMAFGCCIAVVCLAHIGPAPDAGYAASTVLALEFLMKMFYGGIYLNIVLAVFNLIPVPPLDGSHVFAAFLPLHLSRGYQRVGFAGILIIIFLMRVPFVNRGFFTLIEWMFTPFHTLITAMA